MTMNTESTEGLTMGDLEIICAGCSWPPREGDRFVPHDGPCGEECDENLTGCHCAQPDPIPNPLYRGSVERSSTQ